MNNFGETLKDLRIKRGWSQEQLGLELGVSKATISTWEAGKKFPESQRLVDIRRALRVSLDDLFLSSDWPARPLSAREASSAEYSPDIARLIDTVRPLSDRQITAISEMILALCEPQKSLLRGSNVAD